MQYGTSREFLTYFGLGSLEELPSLEEFEDIFGDKADHVRQKDLFDLKLEGIRTVGSPAAPEEDLLPGFDAEG